MKEPLHSILTPVLLAGVFLASIALGAIPTPTGRFVFDGSPHISIGTATVMGATNRGEGLYLNGKYDYFSTNGYTAVFRPSAFNYQRFTLVVELRSEVIAGKRCALLVGGTSCRWLALRVNDQGQLEFSLNNNDFKQVVEDVKVKQDEWLTLAVSFDLKARKSVIYTNGARASQISLPPGFVLRVMEDTKWREYDKVWTFTDFSNGHTFQGLVARLLVFDAVLPDNQVRLLFRKR